MTGKLADFWKKKTAQAIGRPELADAADEKLEKAHADHMDEVARLNASDDGSMIKAVDGAKMPPGPASAATNEQERRSAVSTLINAKMKEFGGCDYNTAFNQVRRENPQLFGAMHQANPKR
jgi:hypothetical protein